MFKIAILSLTLFSAVLAETIFEEIPLTQTFVVKSGDVVSHPADYIESSRSGDNRAAAIPTDPGMGNWGDNLWENRTDSDVLIARETQINTINNAEQKFDWKANFPGKKITHIRFLNIGRERAYVASIAADKKGSSTASAVVHIDKKKQFRLLIEVYAR